MAVTACDFATDRKSRVPRGTSVAATSRHAQDDQEAARRRGRRDDRHLRLRPAHPRQPEGPARSGRCGRCWSWRCQADAGRQARRRRTSDGGRTEVIEPFEIELAGGGWERRYRRERPEIERLPWGTLARPTDEATLQAAR